MSGHLFSGRYKSLIVDGSGSGYLRTVCEYVLLNPARAGLLNPGQALREYVWSSWPETLRPPRKRPAWLRVDRLLGELGIPRDNAAGRRQLERVLEARRASEEQGSYAAIRQGWFLGDGELRKALLARMSERIGSEHYGQERQESQVEKAERVVAEELRRRRWTERTLAQRAKGDPDKVRVAGRLRRETLVTVAWIAERLQMGCVANVNTLL